MPPAWLPPLEAPLDAPATALAPPLLVPAMGALPLVLPLPALFAGAPEPPMLASPNH